MAVLISNFDPNPGSFVSWEHVEFLTSKLKLNAFFKHTWEKKGSGCGAVGKVVDSVTRDLRFESQNQQVNLFVNLPVARNVEAKGRVWKPLKTHERKLDASQLFKSCCLFKSGVQGFIYGAIQYVAPQDDHPSAL